MFVATLAVFYAMLPKTPHREGISGMDFIAFYAAGTFVHEGHSRDLYNLHAIGGYQHYLAHEQGDDLGQAIGPWWNPPYYAWLFVPFAKLSYGSALTRWILCNVLCAAIAATIFALWIRRAASAGVIKGGPWTSRVSAWGLAPVLLVLSTPFIHALSHAQNTCTSLLLLTLVVAAWRREMPLLAGLLLGLLAYKPQLAALVAAIMTICLGWRVLVGLAMTGAVLLGVNVLTLPGTLGDYGQRLPLNLHFVLFETPYLWDRHVTFRAFWRLLLQGYAIGESKTLVVALTSLCCIGLGTYLFSAALRTRQAKAHLPANGRRFDRIIAATIVVTPLLMPFYFDYDQLLLAIPAVLVAVEMLEQPERRWSWVIGLWSAWYGWLMINPDVASITHVNGTVILLAALGSAMVARVVAATHAPAQLVEQPDTRPQALAA
jgi:hypothetical protein